MLLCVCVSQQLVVGKTAQVDLCDYMQKNKKFIFFIKRSRNIVAQCRERENAGDSKIMQTYPHEMVHYKLEKWSVKYKIFSSTQQKYFYEPHKVEFVIV